MKKNDPEKYQQYLNKQRERNRKTRKVVAKIAKKAFPTQEEKTVLEKGRKASRQRSVRFREKQRMEEFTEKMPVAMFNDHWPALADPESVGDALNSSECSMQANCDTPKRIQLPKFFGSNRTRQGKKDQTLKLEEKRRKQRESQRRYREKLSWQKRMAVRDTDKKRKRLKSPRYLKRMEAEKNNSDITQAYPCRKTLYNKSSAAKKVLPRTPSKFTAIIDHYCRQSPNKLKCLLNMTATWKQKQALSKKIVKKAIAIQKVKSKNRSTKKKQKKSQGTHVHGNRLNPATAKTVHDYFFTEEISKPMPHRRYTTKWGAGYIMQVTLATSYKMFCSAYPEHKIGFSKFVTLRPRNVRIISKTHWRYCVCTTCQNIQSKLTCLNGAATRAGMSNLRIKDAENLLECLLCAKSTNNRFHKLECIQRTCIKCKNQDKTLKNVYKPLQDETNSLQWNHWEKTVCIDGKIRKKLIIKKGTLCDILTEFARDIMEPVKNKSFALHHFCAAWQTKQYLHLKENLPENSALLVVDFGRNRTVKHQDEAKESGFGAQQITVHPVVMYYDDENNHRVRDSMMFLSDDIGHDRVAVTYFIEQAIEYLQKEQGMKFNRVFVFSDGCTAQYKGTGTVASMSYLAMHIEWNYFGSDHGKGEADGEVGVLNKKMDSDIIGRSVVLNNAADMVSWAQESILTYNEIASKRHFHLAQIPRDNDPPPSTILLLA
jgi:hypothetical protein